jgi:hypothetical protein
MTPMRSLALLLLASAAAGCAPAAIDLRHVTAIQTPQRLDEGGAAASVEPQTIAGERLRAVLKDARCHAGTVLWKGGVPATLILDDHSRVAADGFSFYGRFLRVHRGQWCELSTEAWTRLWERAAEPQPATTAPTRSIQPSSASGSDGT